MGISPTDLAEKLHLEHTLWSKELSFAEDELRFFDKKLGQVVTQLQDKTLLAKLEHFQNQFIRQREVVDELKHDIGIHEQSLSRQLQQDLPPDDQVADDHHAVRERMHLFRRIFAELKAEFFAYLGEMS